MPFSLNLSPREKKVFRAYAMLNQISLGEALKQALWEKIEDDYDIAIAEEAHREFEESGEEMHDYDEFMKKFGDV